MNLIEQLESEEISRLGKTIPDFATGDTVVVNVKVVEGGIITDEDARELERHGEKKVFQPGAPLEAIEKTVAECAE